MLVDDPTTAVLRRIAKAAEKISEQLEARAVMAEGQSGEAGDPFRQATPSQLYCVPSNPRAEALAAQLARVKEAAGPLLKRMVETETWDDKSVLAINVGSLRALRAALAASPDNAKQEDTLYAELPNEEVRVPPVSEPIAQGRAHEFKVGDKVDTPDGIGEFDSFTTTNLDHSICVKRPSGALVYYRPSDVRLLKSLTPIPPPDLIEGLRAAATHARSVSTWNEIPRFTRGVFLKHADDIDGLLTKYGARQ